MRRSTNWKKVILITWAVLLIFGLAFQADQAAALDSSCGSECRSDCDRCAFFFGHGCNCRWRCVGGGGGSSQCAR